jgi:hypothetical protein
VELLSIALLGVLGTITVGAGYFKINGRKNVTKEDHETLCNARLTPMRTDLKTIKGDVKDILKIVGG